MEPMNALSFYKYGFPEPSFNSSFPWTCLTKGIVDLCILITKDMIAEKIEDERYTYISGTVDEQCHNALSNWILSNANVLVTENKDVPILLLSTGNTFTDVDAKPKPVATLQSESGSRIRESLDKAFENNDFSDCIKRIITVAFEDARYDADELEPRIRRYCSGLSTEYDDGTHMTGSAVRNATYWGGFLEHIRALIESERPHSGRQLDVWHARMSDGTEIDAALPADRDIMTLHGMELVPMCDYYEDDDAQWEWKIMNWESVVTMRPATMNDCNTSALASGWTD